MTVALSVPPRLGPPRVGDIVLWHEKDVPFSGKYLGHLYKRDKGNERCAPKVFCNKLKREKELYNFDVMRLDPNKSNLGPNWQRLPPSALIKPTAQQSERLKGLLGQRMPPGPEYALFLSEIWNRGYEAFVVGGTVRDVIAGRSSLDVDVTTAMPLPNLVSLAFAMYGEKPSIHLLNGYLRIGGSNGSGDPIIDVRVFGDPAVGTQHALFGTEFEPDVEQRDFACNCIYYEPKNDVLIDPTGRGVSDAQESRLHLVCNSGLKSGKDKGEIAIRFLKFTLRGFTATRECLTLMKEEFIPAIGNSMINIERVKYIKRQVLNKYPKKERPKKLGDIKKLLKKLGFSSLYAKYLDPSAEELLG